MRLLFLCVFVAFLLLLLLFQELNFGLSHWKRGAIPLVNYGFKLVKLEIGICLCLYFVYHVFLVSSACYVCQRCSSWELNKLEQFYAADFFDSFFATINHYV